jgi:putative heme-binding domain-containing protein
VYQTKWGQESIPFIADAMLGVDQALAAQFLNDNLELLPTNQDHMLNYVNHIGRLLPLSQLAQFEVNLRSLTQDNLDLQYKVLSSMQNGLAQRPGSFDYGRDWALELASLLLDQSTEKDHQDGELSDVDHQQIYACEIAGKYRVQSLQPELLDLIHIDRAHPKLRIAAARALLDISQENFDQVAETALGMQTSDQLAQELHLLLVEQQTEEAYQLAANVINEHSFNTQKRMLMSMSSNEQGISKVLQVAQSMDISPRMLLEPSIQSVLMNNMNSQQKGVYKQLTKDLVPFSEDIQRLIRERLSGYPEATKSEVAGAAVFLLQCAPCHQIGGKGGDIGPQLDGIGNRGELALTEKILDPNRSISKSFVNYSVALKDGTVKQGLLRREEGNLKVFADMSGAEFSVSKGDIVEQTALPYTLMPDNFSQTISESDYYHLLHYLMEQK